MKEHEKLCSKMVSEFVCIFVWGHLCLWRCDSKVDSFTSSPNFPMLGYYFFTWQKSSKTFLVQFSTAAFALKTVYYHFAEEVKFNSPKNSPLSSSFSISSSSCLVRASSLRSASLGPPVLGGVTWNWNWIRVKRRKNGGLHIQRVTLKFTYKPAFSIKKLKKKKNYAYGKKTRSLGENG